MQQSCTRAAFPGSRYTLGELRVARATRADELPLRLGVELLLQELQSGVHVGHPLLSTELHAHLQRLGHIKAVVHSLPERPAILDLHLVRQPVLPQEVPPPPMSCPGLAWAGGLHCLLHERRSLAQSRLRLRQNAFDRAAESHAVAEDGATHHGLKRRFAHPLPVRPTDPPNGHVVNSPVRITTGNWYPKLPDRLVHRVLHLALRVRRRGFAVGFKVAGEKVVARESFIQTAWRESSE